MFAFPTAFLAGVDVLLERPDFDDARALAESIQLEPAFDRSGMADRYRGRLWACAANGRLDRRPAVGW